ncbi:MAG TPA: glucose-1-phosphate adenylyltransferase [Candidatus Limnocylindria bacterium]|nr:glucose-1-phosphate adenylyltransferase [Candidatus Limnocylindria bacterium]
MMQKKNCVAMLLAGGQGSRLGILTRDVAKPAVPFGGKYRIIDFPLSNCSNSGIDTVGVLTQYKPMELNSYIGSGAPWDLDMNSGGVFVLPPYSRGEAGEWYKGTANAIYQNLAFISQFNPDLVLILSGDHIYKCDYTEMLALHMQKEAALTVAVRPVPWEDTSRFGIMNTDADGFITEFEEKPRNAKSNNASMGVYVFTWDKLRRYLEEDEADPASVNDFGRNIIPTMLARGERLAAYRFNGYWKDVGTVESLWDANMDLLTDPPPIDLHDRKWRIYARNVGEPPHYAAAGGEITDSLVTEGCEVYGKVAHSVLSADVYVSAGAQVVDSVVMPHAVIGPGAVVRRAIVAENAVIGENAQVGGETGDIAVVGSNAHVPANHVLAAGAQMGE